jgi:hypothetical protein
MKVRQKQRRKDNIKMYMEEIGCRYVNAIELIYDGYNNLFYVDGDGGEVFDN